MRDSKDLTLFEKLSEFAGTDMYPFHMPGHKRRFEGFDPYAVDITEIDGFDDMHHPEGLINRLNEDLTEYFGGDRVRILVNGSTSGVLTAISASAEPGEKLLLCSNCHKSAMDAVKIRGIKPVLIDPEKIEASGLWGGIRPEKVREALEREADIKAVFITSPTYEGFLSDVKAVADICHERGIPLIVDSAHGAHAGLYKGFIPSYHFENASLMGADIVIKSLHKNLPAFTQTAILTVNGSITDREKLGYYYSAYQSTSPSYILMAGADRMLSFLKDEGEERFRLLEKELLAIRQEVESLEDISFTGPGLIGSFGIYGFDPTKLLLGHRKKDAVYLYDRLRKDHHLQPEKVSGNTVLLMTSIMDDEQGFMRLKKAIREMA
ncbi:MAG: aminotransferase class I/II-fold pyridoxal phosphate-dependent enzyme [Lachnospiraceae bacterium]|nr:aminotransferase class I/II-fold pyridoxal phosphate-dependent enzyme [Lachnospiraceae bacterium]